MLSWGVDESDYTFPGLDSYLGAGCKVAAGYEFVNGDEDPMDDRGAVPGALAAACEYPLACGYGR